MIDPMAPSLNLSIVVRLAPIMLTAARIGNGASGAVVGWCLPAPPTGHQSVIFVKVRLLITVAVHSV
jgi:hypothetical protein